MSQPPIRLFLVDDHRLFLAGVRSELGDAFEVVGEAGGVMSAIEGVTATKPDVVLLDVHLPDGSGDQVVVATAESSPSTRYLALSVSDAAEDVIAVIRAGARGYVTKTIAPRELIGAIRQIHDGDAVFSPRLAGFVLDAFAGEPPPAIDPEVDQLTPREGEVLRFIARGYTYKEAAAELHLSVRTIESHVSSVLRKLQLSNRRELTRWATARRLV
jgi:Response regulator containing a CheY-like receiver domain and an HTH DNA-binding domain